MLAFDRRVAVCVIECPCGRIEIVYRDQHVIELHGT
jgi:hypothetical protein